MERKSNLNRKQILFTVMAAILLLGSVTYAYFSAITDNNRNQSADLSTAVLALRFADRDNGLKAEMNFGDTVTKKFLIENTGTAEASLSLDWKNLVNTYLNGSLTYRLTYSETEDGEYKELIPKTNVPVSGDRISQAIASEISVPTGETYYYNLDITLNSTEVDQSSDVNAVFNTEFDVGEPSKYRYYRLTVNPAGGEWNEHTTSQEFLLKNGETQDIPNPTRVGYTFTGWNVQGLSSSLEDTTLSMGISDTYLVAGWEANEYTIDICTNTICKAGNEKPIKYDEIVKVSTPSKDGYTFTGWNVIEGNVKIVGNDETGYEFSLIDAANAVIRSNWQTNNYKYIVYNNQMNIDGEGYTLVSADTDEGEAEFNTTVTPETKVYTGFKSPEKRTLRIQHEAVYPPVLNKIEYNYERNKYTLTIDPNGGTYDSETTVKMYYDYNAKLGKAPTKDGYKFDSWLASSGTVTNPETSMSCRMVGQSNDKCYTWFQIGAEDATITAQWTPKEYSVTFNANGGTVDTLSKIVTYDSTYGSLPEPTYSGYTFLGWFTEQEGGTQITSSTTVSILDNQTLFAHWEAYTNPAVTAALSKLGVTPKTGMPDFNNIATTDEGVYSMIDDYGTSYYYRGAVTNNYVKFADKYWRIIRINGDGSLRVIYDGSSAHANGESSVDRVAIRNQPWNLTDGDAKYVGYMYGPEGTTASTSYAQATINTVSSNIKIQLDNWFKTNFVDTIALSGKKYSEYITDAIFCNDRSIADFSGLGWEGLGYGENPTAYGAAGRFVASNVAPFTKKDNPTPTFRCPQKNDAFTVNDTTKGNGALTYPIGLITADEISTAGGSYYKDNIFRNLNYYLYDGNLSWTMSSRDFNNAKNGYVSMLDAHGQLNGYIVNGNMVSIKPVINLKAEYVSQMTGTGTMTEPFQIPDTNSMCFLENTSVYTPNGYRNIQDIKVGDSIYSYNEETREVEVDKVKETMKHSANEYLKVSLADGSIMNVTSNHPMYDAKSNTWKPIGEFKVGDYLRNSEGNDVQIKIIDNIKSNNEVYNFEVEKNHNYFVTKSNILVHNKGGAI